MKRIMYLLMLIFMLPVAANAQYERFISFDDTLTGATAVTKYFRIPIARINIDDTSRSLYMRYRIDTTYIRGTAVGDTSAWADSAVVPSVRVRFRYIMDGHTGASDTLRMGRSAGIQYQSVLDSLLGGIGTWNWVPVKVLGLAPVLEFRVNDVAIRRGAKYGVRVRLDIIGRVK